MDKKRFSAIRKYIKNHFSEPKPLRKTLFKGKTLGKMSGCREEDFSGKRSLSEARRAETATAAFGSISCSAARKIPIVLEESFSEKLLKLIDKTGLSDPDVYKKAGIDRKLFSKIRSNKDYQPSKSTVISFSLGLNLGMDDTLDLLKSAGYALSNSSKFDVIIQYFIEHKIFDIFQVNDALHEFGQPILSF